MEKTFMVGIDEAGRGPLAGPVAVGAVCVPKSTYRECIKLLIQHGVKDSKKLSPVKREKLFTQIKEWQKEGVLRYSVALVPSEIIDTKGIAPAIRMGIRGVLQKLGVVAESTHVLLDGGIVAPKEFTSQETIIKGDDTEPLISLASIVAKVTRDIYMDKIHMEYPEYHFDSHKGYGTKKHYEAIAKYGILSIHRRTFLKNILS